MNKDVRTSKTVYVTTDYSVFKVLKGNRGVDLQRVTQIKESIEVCYIPSPIVVNERMEVIDGQGRLQALKELGLPVYYVIVNGANLDDCIRMNINATPWEPKDYIYSYRDRGNKEYIKLASLVDRYIVGSGSHGTNGSLRTRYSVPLPTIIAGALGSVGGSAADTGRFGSGPAIKKGLFKFLADYDTAVKELDYVASLSDVTPAFGLASKILLFAKRCSAIDEVRLKNQITKYQNNRGTFPAYTNTDECILSLEAVYNYRLPKKIDMRVLYNEYLIERGKQAGSQRVAILNGKAKS